MPGSCGESGHGCGDEVILAENRKRARAAPAGGVKERVSVRSVRKELGRGSFGDIARELRKWKEAEGYRPVIEQADLPEAFERRLSVIARELLEMARVEAARAKLADFVAAEDGRAAERDVLDEALDRVGFLEERVAALQAEVDRLRAGGAAELVGGPVESVVVEAHPDPKSAAMAGIVGELRGRHLAREADAFWARVREAVETTVRRRGPLAIHPLFKALPDRLKQDGERAGFPLTEAWLRYHLLRLVEDGEGLALDGHRFGLAGPAPDTGGAASPEPSPAGAAAELGRRRFWRRFVHEVHDLLAKEGPMTAEDILGRMGPAWVEASKQFQPLTTGRLRYKLRGRIAEERPFEELPDGRSRPCRAMRPGMASARWRRRGTASALRRWLGRSSAWEGPETAQDIKAKVQGAYVRALQSRTMYGRRGSRM